MKFTELSEDWDEVEDEDWGLCEEDLGLCPHGSSDDEGCEEPECPGPS